MSTVVQEAPSGVDRPRLPSWRAALVSALLGVALVWCAVVAATTAAEALGLIGRPAGSGLRDWPYPEAGLSSLAANAVVWVWILALTALVIRGLLADRSTPAISAVPVFCVLALTGFAPGLPRGLLDLPLPAAFVFTVVLLRLGPAFAPPVLSKRATMALLAAGALFLAVPAAHAILHPLWPGSILSVDPSARNAATFSLRNAGFADVLLQGVTLRAPLLPVQLTGVSVDESPLLLDLQRLPYRLDRRSEAFVQLRYRTQACGDGSALRGGEATIRYRVHDAVHAETLPVTIPLRPCA
jgi:hypothetical protein